MNGLPILEDLGLLGQGLAVLVILTGCAISVMTACIRWQDRKVEHAKIREAATGRRLAMAERELRQRHRKTAALLSGNAELQALLDKRVDLEDEARAVAARGDEDMTRQALAGLKVEVAAVDLEIAQVQARMEEGLAAALDP